ncbi:MAG: multiprotein bridging factor aMBF1 [Candidatus Nanoarchaeia archaeon]|nr:multiprotein bridging factor aMBF1 [Candidatus Nanoarchaeia archaeon]
MPQCEICGKATALCRCIIEGCEMSVCNVCSKYGERKSDFSMPLVGKKKDARKEKPMETRREDEKEIVVSSGAGNRVKDAREKKGLTQEQLAKAIAERSSVIQRIEAGHMAPAIATAEKLEKFLGIKLFEEMEAVEIQKGNSENEGFTIADLLKKK